MKDRLAEDIKNGTILNERFESTYIVDDPNTKKRIGIVETNGSKYFITNYSTGSSSKEKIYITKELYDYLKKFEPKNPIKWSNVKD